jgi:hypothetical protein
MARFMIAHLQGGVYESERILGAGTARLMHDTALPIVPPLHSMLLGFMQGDLNGRRIVEHGGDTQYFHSALSLFIDDGVGLYLSVNSTGKEGAAGPIRRRTSAPSTPRPPPGMPASWPAPMSRRGGPSPAF